MMVIILAIATSCTQEEENTKNQEGMPLRLSVALAPHTRLAELPSPDAMTQDPGNKGLKEIGLYIYYTEDYNNGDLSKPYIRNQRFTVQDGELVAAEGTGTDQLVYIYDRMTIVAFYPYNETMSLEENYFATKADEDKYPITRYDYENQYYIPYRAETTTDPTIAYYTVLTFYPKFTYKLEVVVVAEDNSIFPGEIELLSGIDPTTTQDTLLDGKRATWYDIRESKGQDGSGSYVQQYAAYIWTRNGNKNELKKGDILLKSNELTLIASQDLYPSEDLVYRYGYNMSTGEIFIPTSSDVVYDKTSLAAVNATGGSYYQVCDIDLSGGWNPISLIGGRYDGGGHQLTNMNVTATSAEGDAGLFGKVQGNAVLTNVNLINPIITVSRDSASVGALVGQVNTPMTEAEKEKLIGNLPPGLSEIVKEALIQELLANAGNSQSNVAGNKVTNPTIVVTGKDVKVEGLAGEAGEKTDAGDSKSSIWDSAVEGGSITVNENLPANNNNAYIGGFVGLNQGYIGRTYTSVGTITAQAESTDEDGNPITVDKYVGFGTMGDDFTPEEGGLIESSYAALPDNNSGVTQLLNGWPSWSTYTGIWPVETTSWTNGPSNSFWYNMGAAHDTYPTLQWERK